MRRDGVKVLYFVLTDLTGHCVNIKEKFFLSSAAVVCLSAHLH